MQIISSTRYRAFEKGVRLLWLILTTLCFCAVAALAAPTKMVQIEGTAIWSGNEEASRRAAVNDGKWRAVRQVLGRTIDSRQLGSYVQNYRIVGGGREGDRYVAKRCWRIKFPPLPYR